MAPRHESDRKSFCRVLAPKTYFVIISLLFRSKIHVKLNFTLIGSLFINFQADSRQQNSSIWERDWIQKPLSGLCALISPNWTDPEQILLERRTEGLHSNLIESSSRANDFQRQFRSNRFRMDFILHFRQVNGARSSPPVQCLWSLKIARLGSRISNLKFAKIVLVETARVLSTKVSLWPFQWDEILF